MSDVHDHISSVGKTLLGGAVTAGTTHVVFDLAQATEIASLAAAIATTIYFIVSTIIAIMKWRHDHAGD